MEEKNNFDEIAKYLSDNSNSEERENLFKWVDESKDNKALLEDSMEVWELSEDVSFDFQPNVDSAWEKMNRRLGEERKGQKEDTKIRPIYSRTPMWRVAAAAILVMGLTWWIFQPNSNQEWIEEQTLVAEKTKIALPDGSSVWLNQNSTLKYEKFFDKRVVYLEGEAFFEVVKKNGKSFEIYADDSKTTVLGTSFNIRAYPDERDVELTVATGKVAFEATKNTNENALLSVNEYAIFTKKDEEVTKKGKAKLNAYAWKKEALNFKNSSMTDIFEALERYFNVEIKVSNKNIYNCTLNSTSTYTRPVLETILQQIEYTTNNLITISKESDGIYVFSGEGCQ